MVAQKEHSSGACALPAFPMRHALRWQAAWQPSGHQPCRLSTDDAGKGLMAHLACNMAEEVRAREHVLEIFNHMQE